ncbi:hypothetical protein F511_07181 [Dorcoceras hygrometricum]|uniref:Uncharacterized protein n=1 Tax=Dorcoceras hygrometricum TaxID=472368 RepID=A0A2Z7AXX0_9LAMI|nr:hypothetical protein F511_07181 [Dorcoceras hygrometricum]
MLTTDRAHKQIPLIKHITLSLAIQISHTNQLLHFPQLSLKQIAPLQHRRNDKLSPKLSITNNPRPKLKPQPALIWSDNHEQLSPNLKSLNDAAQHQRSISSSKILELFASMLLSQKYPTKEKLVFHSDQLVPDLIHAKPDTKITNSLPRTIFASDSPTLINSTAQNHGNQINLHTSTSTVSADQLSATVLSNQLALHKLARYTQ